MSELEAECRRRVGTMVRRKYRLDSLLGYGAMGAVFAATHRNGNRVALKVLHPILAHQEDIRNRFLREAYVANRVPHPGVVRIADDDDDDDLRTVFLVMELLEGATLSDRANAYGGKLRAIDAVKAAVRVLDVLAVAHELGIIHRDVKPENVFCCTSGEVKVLDFGIARVAELTSVTRSNQIMGTPAFMAPEQASGRIREVDARTDVWAVGALLFRLIAGRDVHLAPNATVQLIYAATQQAPLIASTGAPVSPALGSIIDRALLMDKEARWSSAREMQAALATALPTGGLVTKTVVQGSGS